MREIKFRAYIRCGEWEEDGSKQKYKMCYDLAFEEHEPINDLLAGVENLMQFTGLQDKNGTGKDIYEGDIMQTAPPVEFYRFVYYSAPDWILLCCNSKKEGVRFGLGAVNNSSHPDAIVVGNIYENPELLK